MTPECPSCSARLHARLWVSLEVFEEHYRCGSQYRHGDRARPVRVCRWPDEERRRREPVRRA